MPTRFIRPLPACAQNGNPKACIFLRWSGWRINEFVAVKVWYLNCVSCLVAHPTPVISGLTLFLPFITGVQPTYDSWDEPPSVSHCIFQAWIWGARMDKRTIRLVILMRPDRKPPMKNLALVYWLVVLILTILKNISQWEGPSHILWKIKNVPNHQPV